MTYFGKNKKACFKGLVAALSSLFGPVIQFIFMISEEST